MNHVLAWFIVLLFSASAFSLPDGVTPELIKRTVAKMLNSHESYQDAIRLLYCGNKLPQKHEEEADVILYHAYAVPEENALNATSINRLEATLALYNQGLGKHVVVTGNGYPKTNFANSGRDFLVRHNVPKSDIIMEANSKTTWENLVNLIGVLQDLQAHSVILVSSPYHIDRILRYYEKLQAMPEYAAQLSTVKVYWYAYNPKKDAFNQEEQRKQVIHELYTVVLDHWDKGNALRSARCQDYDKSRGASASYVHFVDSIMSRILTAAQHKKLDTFVPSKL